MVDKEYFIDIITHTTLASNEVKSITMDLTFKEYEALITYLETIHTEYDDNAKTSCIIYLSKDEVDDGEYESYFLPMNAYDIKNIITNKLIEIAQSI